VEKNIFFFMMMVTFILIGGFSFGQNDESSYWDRDWEKTYRFLKDDGRLVEIGDWAICNGEVLYNYTGSDTSIVIPSNLGIKFIAYFPNAKNITSVIIPEIENVGIFFHWLSLISIGVDENNSLYSSEDGVLFNKEKTSILKYPQGKKSNTYIIPDSVTTIEEWAFENCVNLKSITIPDNVTTIGAWAFSGCTSLDEETRASITERFGEEVFEDLLDLIID